MDAWIWIVIALGVVVVLGLAALWWTRSREQRLVERRVEADELRREASARARKAKEREELSEELAERAAHDRAEAERAAARAGEVDPDADR